MWQMSATGWGSDMGGVSPLSYPPKGSNLKRYVDYLHHQAAVTEMPEGWEKANDVFDHVNDPAPLSKTKHWLYRELMLRSEMDTLYGEDYTNEIFSDGNCRTLLDMLTADRLEIARLNVTRTAERNWQPKKSNFDAISVVCAAFFEAVLECEEVQPMNRHYVTVAHRLGITREVVRGVVKQFVLRKDTHRVVTILAIITSWLMVEADGKEPEGLATLHSEALACLISEP
ncbi:hypothetical protein LCGC14_1811700, partial [marine sediment metagenome]